MTTGSCLRRDERIPRRARPSRRGPTKKQKRYAKQAAEHKDTARQAQNAHAYWDPDTTHYMTHEADSQARTFDDREKRSGSDSNTDSGTRGY